MQENSVDQVTSSEKPPRPSITFGDDIPEALRENVPAIQPKRNNAPLVWGSLGITAIALGAGGFFAWQQFGDHQPSPEPVQTAATRQSPAGATPQPGASTQPDVPAEQPLLGHLPYKEAPDQTLQSIVADGSIKLRRAAAQKFLEMVDAANAAGVFLRPISGFRSIASQEHVFFDVKAERAEGTLQRAAVSAPPGYSEHHTGYAIDIGDGAYPETELQTSFDNTPAFKWLQQNAARFSFEMSFPKNNPQGVSYEPWHWRFVGDRNSLETFYRAHTLAGDGQPASQNNQSQPSQDPLSSAQSEQSAGQSPGQSTGQ